jgi:uncharacterized repeat protein (TIGR01451 family)
LRSLLRRVLVGLGLSLVAAAGGATAVLASGTDSFYTDQTAPAVAAVAQPFTWTIGVHDDGTGHDDQNVVVTDTLPAGVTAASMSPDCGDAGSAGGVDTVTCDVSTLPDGSSTTETVEATPTETGTMTNVVNAVADYYYDDSGTTEETTETAPPSTLTTLVSQTTTAPPPLQETLTATLSGSGSGTVGSAPSGIDCAGVCSASFDQGTQVTLTAAPDPGSRFAGWSGGGCSGLGDCQLTMSSGQLVTATFVAIDPLTVTRTGSATGTVTSDPAGIDCGTSCSQSFDQGTLVTLTATPAGAAIFSGWSGACSGTGSCRVTVDQARSVAAEFEPLPPPTISGVTPAKLADTGGAQVQINGSWLQDATSVRFGTQTAAITSDSTGSVTVTAPQGVPGTTVAVTVTTVAGSASIGGVGYEPVPTVSSVAPRSGAPAGFAITISGSGFGPDTTFTVGDTPATNVHVQSPTLAYAYAPGGLGTVAVMAQSPVGAAGAATLSYRPVCPSTSRCKGKVSATVGIPNLVEKIDDHTYKTNFNQKRSGSTMAAANASNSIEGGLANYNAHANGDLYDAVATATNDSTVNSGFTDTGTPNTGVFAGAGAVSDWAIRPTPHGPVQLVLAYSGTASAHVSVAPGDNTQDDEDAILPALAEADWSVGVTAAGGFVPSGDSGEQSASVASVSDTFCDWPADAGWKCGSGAPHRVYTDESFGSVGPNSSGIGNGSSSSGLVTFTATPEQAESLEVELEATALAHSCVAPVLAANGTLILPSGPTGSLEHFAVPQKPLSADMLSHFGRCTTTASASVDPVIVSLTPGYAAVALGGQPHAGEPELLARSSVRAAPGARWTLTGTNLGSRRGTVLLARAGHPARRLRVLSWNATRIVVRVPATRLDGVVTARTAGGALSGPMPLIVSNVAPASVTAVAPAVAAPGQTIRLSGFGLTKATRITIRGRRVRRLDRRGAALYVVVPRGLRAGPARIIARAPQAPAMDSGSAVTIAGTARRTIGRRGGSVEIAGIATLTVPAGALRQPRRIALTVTRRRSATVVMVSTAGRLRAPAILSLPASLSGAGRIVAASPHSAHPTPTAGSPGQVAASIIASGSYSVHST